MRATRIYEPQRTVRNWPGWLSLILGLLAAGLALYPLTQFGVGQGYFASTVGLSAIGYGVFALALQRRGDSTVRMAPIVGVLLGLFGTLLMGSSVVNYYLQDGSFNAPSTLLVGDTSFTLEPQSDTPPVPVPAEPASAPAPLVFTSAAEERAALIQNLGTIHFVLNQIAPATKPASLLLATPGGTLSTPEGHALTILPEGTVVNYGASADASTYVITLTGATFGTAVQLDSAVGQIVALQ
jgi:hypothetical protein